MPLISPPLPLAGDLGNNCVENRVSRGHDTLVHAQLSVPNILKEAGNKQKADSRCSLHEDDKLARTLFYLPQRLNVKAFLCLNGIHRTSRFSANNGPGVLNRNTNFTITLKCMVEIISEALYIKPKPGYISF